jgi:phenylalanine-4-hydroxylase
MTILPLDVAAMGTQDYDITHYQEVLFAGRSFAEVQDVVGGFWESSDDDSIARLRGSVH